MTTQSPPSILGGLQSGWATALPALTLRLPRPTTPGPDVARRHGAGHLADHLEQLSAAETQAVLTAREWLAAEQGGEPLRDVLEQDRLWGKGFLDNGRQIPDDTGPLVVWLTAGRHQLFTDAWRAQVAADHALIEVYAVGADPELVEHLDRLTDDLADEMQVLFEKARDDRDRRAFDDAVELAGTWAEASSLYEWCTDTSKSYRRRSPNSIPKDLARVWFEASTELGEQHFEIPDAVLDGSLPQPMITPGNRKESEPEVIGDQGKKRWGRRRR